MNTNRYLPDINRISVLTAIVLLALALTRLLSAASYQLGFQAFGRVLRFDVDLRVIIVLLASGLTATGMDWLLRGHPLMKGKNTIEHWLLPMLTALVVGTPLYLLPSDTFWWLGFGIGGLLLVLVFWAEYVVVSPGDTNYPIAMVVLTVLSFALYLIMALALRYAGGRLLLLAPLFFAGTFLVSLRTLRLRLRGRWEITWSLGIALVGIQLAAGLHYWKMTPIQYGMFLLGILYALTSLAASILEGMPLRRAVAEPIGMLALVWGMGIWFG